MSFSLFLNGALNWTVLGIPYYLWIIVALVIIGAIIGACFYFFYWWRLTPYHGVFWAHVKKIGASLVFDENQHFDLITDRSAKVIFNETFAEAQDAEDNHTESQPATLGIVRVDFIFDPDKWTYPNTLQHRTIEDIAEQWGENNPDDKIRTLIKFSQYLHEGKFDSGFSDKLANLKRYYVVPWWRIKAMYSQRKLDDVYGYSMSLARTIEEAETPSYNAYAWIFLGFFGIIDLCVILAHFLK